MAIFRPQNTIWSLLAGVVFVVGNFVPAAAGEGDPVEVEAEDVIVRPNAPERPPDPAELKLQPDNDGRIRFNFHGQPWPGVLEWIARVSHLNLDWQELPAGHLNLRTQRSYAVEEARDLINRYLLDRGFTMLRHGEVLSVVNIRKLDVSLVPRLMPDELERAQPHDFARVSFPLEWMMAETAVEELKPLVSPNGKLTSLKSTNRLEAVDAVANLREIRKLLSDEQSPRSRERLVREFNLQFVRADEVLPQLQKLLGLEKNAVNVMPQTNDPAALLQQVAALAQRAKGGSGTQNELKSPPVHLAVNSRDNSILAHAPADQMAVIAEAVKLIDNPADKSRSLLQNSHRVQTYRLTAADPDSIVKTVQELGDLAPGTQLKVDRKHRSIVAHATLVDHLTIRTLIEKLDGSVRSFRVVKLRRVDADYVAASIDLVMGKSDAARQPPAGSADDETRRFRVVADVESNRLLITASDSEFQEIYELLKELGEVPATGNDPVTIRVPDSLDSAEAGELVRRLQKRWPDVAPNPLEVGPGMKPADPAVPGPANRPEAPPATESKPRPAASIENNDNSHLAAAARPQIRLPPVRLIASATVADAAVDSGQGTSRHAESETVGPELPSPASATGEAVRIDRDAEGRLTITSHDAAAAELLKKLALQEGLTHKNFKVFRMKHKSTWANTVAENLKQYFDEKQKAEPQPLRWYDPSGQRWISSSRSDDGRRLSKTRPPKFVADMDTNSILAVGADAEQLKAIEELIDLFDTPAMRERRAVRLTRHIRIHHAPVRMIADAVKEVYRDLLSVNETVPPGAAAGAPKEPRPPQPTYTFAYNTRDGKADEDVTLVKFKGLLSIGIDEFSRGLVVSAPESVLEDVEATIKALDEAAEDSLPRVRVVQLDRNLNTADVHKRLQKMLGKPESSGQASNSSPSGRN
jgi:type II secretory pathway component GspD/PulD (secretin)